MALVDLILRLQKGEPLTNQEMDNNLSNLLAGIVQSSCDWAGPLEPEETFPYLRWIDTSTNPPTNKIRNAEDDGWITLGSATTPLGTAASRNVGTGPDQVPTNSALGTAATRDVTTSNADTTAGRLLKVGDLGSNRHELAAVDFNDLPDLYPYSGAVPVMSNVGSSNVPPKGGNIFYHVVQYFYSSGGNVTQIAIPYRVDSDGMWMRSRYGGTWSPWREIYHSGNLSKSVKYGGGIVESGGIGTANNAPGTVDFSGNTVLTGLRTEGSGNGYTIYARGRTLTI